MPGRPWWQEVLQPGTDRAIAIEAVVFLAVSAVMVVGTWRWSSARLLVIGAILIIAGLFGLRAVH